MFFLIQVQTKEEESGGMSVSSNNIFRAIAMMDIQIDDGYPGTIVTFRIEGMEGTDSNIIEDTKTARFRSLKESFMAGMVPWRTDDTKSVSVSASEDSVNGIGHCPRSSSSRSECAARESSITVFSSFDVTTAPMQHMFLYLRREWDNHAVGVRLGFLFL